jgi:hypothetical protein
MPRVLSGPDESADPNRLEHKPRDKAMSGKFDYDVIVIGSGFGGSVPKRRC